MLLLYLKVIGIKSGYLFPNKKRAAKVNLHEGVEEAESITYTQF